jgi:hypothetical protein
LIIEVVVRLVELSLHHSPVLAKGTHHGNEAMFYQKEMPSNKGKKDMGHGLWVVGLQQMGLK